MTFHHTLDAVDCCQEVPILLDTILSLLTYLLLLLLHGFRRVVWIATVIFKSFELLSLWRGILLHQAVELLESLDMFVPILSLSTSGLNLAHPWHRDLFAIEFHRSLVSALVSLTRFVIESKNLGVILIDCHEFRDFLSIFLRRSEHGVNREIEVVALDFVFWFLQGHCNMTETTLSLCRFLVSTCLLDLLFLLFLHLSHKIGIEVHFWSRCWGYGRFLLLRNFMNQLGDRGLRLFRFNSELGFFNLYPVKHELEGVVADFLNFGLSNWNLLDIHLMWLIEIGGLQRGCWGATGVPEQLRRRIDWSRVRLRQLTRFFDQVVPCLLVNRIWSFELLNQLSFILLC